MQFSILRKQLKAMSRLAPKSDTRYYLNGLHVVQDNRGTYIESTNGHVLGRLLINETPVANPCSVILPLESVKTLAATGKKGMETICFSVDGVKITAINPQGETMIFQAVKGKFPDCDRVVPTVTVIAPLNQAPITLSIFKRLRIVQTICEGTRQKA